jgi:hypothetical protein
MARPLRIGHEETFYHVLNRGNARQAVFRDARDCEGRKGFWYGWAGLPCILAWTIRPYLKPVAESKSG